MSEPGRAVRWLEDETGTTLERAESAATQDSRHLSLRLPLTLFEQLEQHAAIRGETLSQAARRILRNALDGIAHPDHASIDAAIAALEELKHRPPPPAA